MKQPWMKFFPVDWRADPKLRKCGLAAQGLWINLCGYMHEAEPYGHLLLDGIDTEVEEIALLVSRPLAEVAPALADLANRGVFNRTAQGVIYSRRMVRFAVRSEQNTKNGLNGGNPNLKRDANRTTNREQNRTTNRNDQVSDNQIGGSDNRNGVGLTDPVESSDKTQKLDARSYKLEEASTSRSTRASEPEAKTAPPTESTAAALPPGSHSPAAHALADALLAELDIEPGGDIPFEIMGYLERAELWAAGSISKGLVVEAARVAKAENGATFPSLRFIEGILIKRAQKLKDRISRPLATNGAAVRPPVTYQAPKPIVVTDEQWIVALKTYRQHGMWSAPGNAPNCGGCLVPQAILDTHGYGRKKA